MCQHIQLNTWYQDIKVPHLNPTSIPNSPFPLAKVNRKSTQDARRSIDQPLPLYHQDRARVLTSQQRPLRPSIPIHHGPAPCSSPPSLPPFPLLSFSPAFISPPIPLPTTSLTISFLKAKRPTIKLHRPALQPQPTTAIQPRRHGTAGARPGPSRQSAEPGSSRVDQEYGDEVWKCGDVWGGGDVWGRYG
jgi:hypothetical protein